MVRLKDFNSVIPVTINVYFNSSMVRLKEFLAPLSRGLLRDFNSSMVRLIPIKGFLAFSLMKVKTKKDAFELSDF
jgi:hypothetical protein